MPIQSKHTWRLASHSPTTHVSPTHGTRVTYQEVSTSPSSHSHPDVVLAIPDTVRASESRGGQKTQCTDPIQRPSASESQGTNTCLCLGATGVPGAVSAAARAMRSSSRWSNAKAPISSTKSTGTLAKPRGDERIQPQHSSCQHEHEETEFYARAFTHLECAVFTRSAEPLIALRSPGRG